MDPTKLLEADHRQVEDLLDQIESAEAAARAQLVDQLATALRAHMAVEEEVVYPGMEPVTGREKVEEGVNEHLLARQALDQVVELAPDGPGFEGALEVLRTGIEHHVEDEEGEVFPRLRGEGADRLAAMEERFMEKRAELGLPTDPTAIAGSLTKADLLEEAKAAGVRGAASMTKDELARALREGT